MAIDRDLINKSILVGLGKSIYAPTGYEQSTPHWQGRWFVEYDPEGAKTLPAEAGYPDGFEMGFWIRPFVNPEVGVTIAGQRRDIGIDVQIENTAYSARRPILVDRSVDIPWHFINSAEGGFFGNMYGRWRRRQSWNSGVEFPYDIMKDWDTRYLALDRNTQGVQIIALLLISAFFAELLTPYDPEKGELTPATSHPYGRKAAVRNTYSALIHSAEASSLA